MGDAGCCEIADAIDKVGKAAGHGRRKSSKLKTLVLACNHIGDEGAAALARAMVQTACLATLRLSENPIRLRGISALAAALECHCAPKLEELQLSRAPERGDDEHEGRVVEEHEAMERVAGVCTKRQIALAWSQACE